MKNPGDNLQERALPRSVFANNTERFSPLYVESDIPQSPKIVVVGKPIEGNQLPEPVFWGMVDRIAFGDLSKIDNAQDGRPRGSLDPGVRSQEPAGCALSSPMIAAEERFCLV